MTAAELISKFFPPQIGGGFTIQRTFPSDVLAAMDAYVDARIRAAIPWAFQETGEKQSSPFCVGITPLSSTVTTSLQ